MNKNKFRVWDNVMKMWYPSKLNDIREHIFIKSTERNGEFEIDTFDSEGNRYTLVRFTGLQDRNKRDIYEGDVIELINDEDNKIIAICEYGIVRRQIFENEVDIQCFYFRVPEYDNKKTFPIVNNYCGKHDLELFEIIGNIYENPELLENNAKK